MLASLPSNQQVEISMGLTKTELIQKLQLERHPFEGGYFTLTHATDLSVDVAVGNRKALTTIYYMLTDDSPCGTLHRNKSDIVHFYHAGAAIRYWVISEQGQLTEHWLGPDMSKGQQLQLVVKGGDWKISQLVGGDYCLIGEAVAPGFEYCDNEIATLDLVKTQFPHLLAKIENYVHQNPGAT
jgi:uncharacterized protein